MKIKTTLHLFSLLFYPCIVLSADSDFMHGMDNDFGSARFNNKTNQRLIDQDIITDIRKIIDYKKIKNITQNRFNNKSEYKTSDNCRILSSGEGCASSDSFLMGTISSYIGEYSVFAVIGAGIRLPEEQIESFNGLDD